MSAVNVTEASAVSGAIRVQTLDVFRDRAGETLRRLRETGDAEVLTSEWGSCVLLSPAAYDEMLRAAGATGAARDATAIQAGAAAIAGGKGRPAEEVFDEIRHVLLSLKAFREGVRR